MNQASVYENNYYITLHVILVIMKNLVYDIVHILP